MLVVNNLFDNNSNDQIEINSILSNNAEQVEAMRSVYQFFSCMTIDKSLQIEAE